MRNRTVSPFIILVVISLLLAAALLASAQTTVTAEAIGQANLRAAPDVTANLLGEIRVGTRYPVIARHELYPWLLLGNPTTGQPIGWVFLELLTVQGDRNTLPFSTLVVDPSAPPVPSISANAPSATPNAPAAQPSLSALAAAPGTPTLAPSPTAATGVIGTVQGEINIRYGPGTEFDRIGVGRVGETFEVVAWHTQLPWVQVRYPISPNGFAWIALDLLEIEGDLYSLPSTSQTRFDLPTLTPTPSVIQGVSLPGLTPMPLSAEFAALGDLLWSMVLAEGFDPATSRLGALFLMNLRTGESLSFGSDTAFSGMSINKIGILARYFADLNALPNDEQAYTIAEAMICSENISSNELLATVGGGNPYTGAERVTELLEQLGLERTFIYTPFDNDPFITPQAPRTRTTSANQTAAQPDPYNQMTVGEIGALLNGIYQCGVNGTGPLIDQFGGQFTQTECRQMLSVMSYNRIGALIESGVPETVRVAHKHGWIGDTHGDAGIVFSPGGDYILVMVLHNPTWLEYSESFPLMEEMSRLVYNYFNPDAPLPATLAGDVPAECNLLGSPVIEALLSPSAGG